MDIFYEPRLTFPLNSFKVDSDIAWASNDPLENVVVELSDGEQYQLNFISLDRLDEEFTASAKAGRPFYGKSGMVVVSVITRWVLRIAVYAMYKENYFSRVMPISSKKNLSGPAELVFPETFDRDCWDHYSRGYIEELTARLSEGSSVPVSIFIPLRLRQEITAMAMYGLPYYAEPGLIIVDEISRNAATTAVAELAKEGVFGNVKAVDG